MKSSPAFFKNPTLIFGIVLFIIIAFYSLFQAKNLILGPVLTIEEPKNGATLPFSIYTVKGSAKNISFISLNDSPIFVDDEGRFEEKLIAPSGYSIMKMMVEDRFGRKKTQFIHLFNPNIEELEIEESASSQTNATSSIITEEPQASENNQ